VKGQIDPSGQIPFSHSRQWGLIRGGDCRKMGSCSRVEERDVARLCWGLGVTGGGPEDLRPRTCGLCWGEFELPVYSGAPDLDGGRLGCEIGMLAEGSETLRVVLGLDDLCGVVGNADGSVVRDKARFGRGRLGWPPRWPSTEGRRTIPVGKGTWSWG
jgi:hypothetical protein